MPRLLLFLFATTAACTGAPPGPCAPDAGCPAGQACVDGACQPALPPAEQCPATGANVLINASFECGEPPTGWLAHGGDLASEADRPKSGARAARLTAKTGTLVNLWYQADAVVAPGTRTYCARAWMRGTARDGRLTIRRVAKGAGGVDETFSSPLTAEWSLVPPYNPLKVVATDDERFLLRAWIPDARAGDVLVVDDVALWESPDGTCKER